MGLDRQVSTIPESKELLANMTRAEKAELLQWLVSDLGDTFPGIETHAGVAGGEPCTWTCLRAPLTHDITAVANGRTSCPQD